jgi:hypothetical protein
MRVRYWHALPEKNTQHAWCRKSLVRAGPNLARVCEEHTSPRVTDLVCIDLVGGPGTPSTSAASAVASPPPGWCWWQNLKHPRRLESRQEVVDWWTGHLYSFKDLRANKGLLGFILLKFNSHHINVPSNVWSTKCRLIACMSVQIRSNLRDESIKPN